MIKPDSHQFEATDGMTIHYYTTPRNRATRAMLIIVHGMSEHARRYDAFSDFLYRNGIITYTIDQRGHGITGQSTDNLGYFADYDGWQRVVDDIQELSAIANNEHPDLPLFIFGHSMGSIVVRSALIEFGRLYHGSIICGTTLGLNAGARAIAEALAQADIKRHGPHHISKTITRLTIGGYNRAFKPNRTDYDWLSINEDNIDTFLSDPLCGFDCSSAFYYDLFSGLDFADNPSNIAEMPESLPVLILSGANDPVGAMGHDPRVLYHRMRNAGLTDVTLRLIPNSRHEVLNETNWESTASEIIDFMIRRVAIARNMFDPLFTD